MRRTPEARKDRGAAIVRCATAVLAASTVWGLAAPFSVSTVRAQTTKASPDEAARALEAKRNELLATEQRAKSLESDVKALDDERRKINERLVETAALIQSSEARMSAIEARLGELEAQEKLLRGSLNQRHGQISSLLSALLRMGRNPPPVMITQREDALKMVRSAMLLASAFPELRGKAMALVGRLEELVRVMTDVRTESDRLKAETQRLAHARTRLAGLMETKKQSIGERQAELEKVRIAAQEISKNVSDLGELITKLDQAVTRNTNLAAYEEESRQQLAAARQQQVTGGSPPAPEQSTAASDLIMPPVAAPSAAIAAGSPTPSTDSGTTVTAKETQVAVLTPPPKPVPPRVIELAPAGAGSLVPRDSGRIKPALPFELAKARLPLPAQGRRVLAFGEKTNFGGHSKGLVLETRHSAQITSPTDGWIVYAGEFRSYGQLLIINAGGGYHILLAGLSQIDVQPGQFVLAAEPVGTMGASPRNAAGGTPASAPVLYVEFRKDGRPIDPDPWWVEDARKVQNFGQQKVQG